MTAQIVLLSEKLQEIRTINPDTGQPAREIVPIQTRDKVLSPIAEYPAKIFRAKT